MRTHDSICHHTLHVEKSAVDQERERQLRRNVPEKVVACVCPPKSAQKKTEARQPKSEPESESESESEMKRRESPRK